jgi:hypothetical protein
VARLNLTVSVGADYMKNAPSRFKTLYWKTAVGFSYSAGALAQ